MKPRHAAALALIGWYFITPPLSGSDEQLAPIRDAPRSQWIRSEEFASRAECGKERKKLLDEFYYGPNPLKPPGVEKDIRLGECIASDDPRLKPK